MRPSVFLAVSGGYLAAAQASSTVSVYDLGILRRLDQTMVGSIITEMPSATVLAYSCPDEFGCGTATITNGTSTFAATITTSAIPGQPAGTEIEKIDCAVTNAERALCTHNYVTITAGQTATYLSSTTVEDDFVMMPIVVPATAGGSTYTPSSTPPPTSVYTTYSPPTPIIYTTPSPSSPTIYTTYSPTTPIIYTTYSPSAPTNYTTLMTYSSIPITPSPPVTTGVTPPGTTLYTTGNGTYGPIPTPTPTPSQTTTIPAGGASTNGGSVLAVVGAVLGAAAFFL